VVLLQLLKASPTVRLAHSLVVSSLLSLSTRSTFWLRLVLAQSPSSLREAWVTLHGADGAIIEAAANTVAVTNSRLVTVSAAGSLAAGVVVTVHMLAS
jgi:hypothetical protein